MARTREFDLDAAVDAAMEVFRRKGYEGASMRDLAEATGLGSGSLYAAFGSKDGLYLAALDRYRQRYAAPLADMLRAGSDAREVIREVFIGVIDDIVGDGRRLACLIVGASMERAQHDLRVAERLRSTTQSLELALYDLLAEGQLRGQIPANRSPGDLAGFLVTSLQGLRVMGAINPDRAALMRSAEVALSCLT
ncbi:helix-turn-helix domain-containing protein [Micromonospora sp. 4G57]|uniref:Helix-turn-helix domain-containing protein n=1 Tax=Micromonospora sicca TaxID=2202420 RepID=A0ABU5JLA6_9ACTN|nr:MULTISPECIES: helix-turn-helix domain-containing protein [unclassified Micromonospora]MDZ5446403.1 helix-turn-helix domain-containing protein [Micromonospora sp. 4G57]MDZ5493408.1 helix-turn-helix domain-containing protein [Micromonospora sp. 4G53]